MIGISQDTIYAPATIPGTGAISVIRLSGPDAFAIADRLIALPKGKVSDMQGYSMKFGRIFSSEGELIDDVIVSAFRAPHSYTGEDGIEVSCHASSYIVGEILSLLSDFGARMAEPGEFTMRAYFNGKMDLAQAESVADVIASQDAASHRVAMSQLKGGYSDELRLLRDSLLHITALMELELDFSEEDVEFADRTELMSLLDNTLSHIKGLKESFRLGNAIKDGVPVAIVGNTNAGKSTLLNLLVGEERAIVSDIAGTTRDTVEETVNLGGVRFRFIDTAGIRETEEAIERIGIDRAYRKLSEASVVICMLDATSSVQDNVRILNHLLSKVDFALQEFILVFNKCDLASEERLSVLQSAALSCLSDFHCGSVSCPVTGSIGGSQGDFYADIQVSDPEELVGATIPASNTDWHCGPTVLAGDYPNSFGSESSESCDAGCLNSSSSEEEDSDSGAACSCGVSPIHLDAACNEVGAHGDTYEIYSESGSRAHLGGVCYVSGSQEQTDEVYYEISSQEHIKEARSESGFTAEHPDVSSIEINYKVQIIRLSALNHTGLHSLTGILAEHGRRLVGASGSSVMVTNLRHYQALSAAYESLSKVSSGLLSGVPTDLVTMDIRQSLYHLGSILGEISTDEILGEIFGKFCIGK